MVLINLVPEWLTSCTPFLTLLHSEKVKQKKIRIRFNKDLGTLNRHYVKYYNTTSLMSENKKKKALH